MNLAREAQMFETAIFIVESKEHYLSDERSCGAGAVLVRSCGAGAVLMQSDKLARSCGASGVLHMINLSKNCGSHLALFFS